MSLVVAELVGMATLGTVWKSKFMTRNGCKFQDVSFKFSGTIPRASADPSPRSVETSRSSKWRSRLAFCRSGSVAVAVGVVAVTQASLSAMGAGSEAAAGIFFARKPGAPATVPSRQKPCQIACCCLCCNLFSLPAPGSGGPGDACR